MLDSIVYAKKLVLPTSKANSIQTLQMAAAFSDLADQEGIRLFFHPGLRIARNGLELKRYLAGLGIETGSAASWLPLGARQRGLYGLRFRFKVLTRLAAAKNPLFYTRDLGEAALIATARGLPFFRGRGIFLFEMHEILSKQRQAAEKKHWPGTRRQEQSILEAIDGLVVTNPVLAEETRQLFNYRKPVLVEPNCHSERVFRPVDLFSAEHPWPAADSGLRINLIYFGNIRESKGVGELLKAMRLLPERFHLTVIGRGYPEYMADLEELRRKIPDEENRVRFTGFVPQADLHKICSSAHISIIPQQKTGGFFSPLKLNESLALGLPVSATPLKIFEHVAGLTHTAPDCSAAGLAEAIAGLAANPGLAEELRRRGLSAVKQYTWGKRARRIFEFAQNLTAE
ncbi:MAG: glycosyltransferase [Deltaproteobacteria bacterium]|jgi:glycosyltransferase involved in cell wall biosynthesis|nr:glycosyltransferase [Deltaproteobacteria bacterium]